MIIGRFSAIICICACFYMANARNLKYKRETLNSADLQAQQLESVDTSDLFNKEDQTLPYKTPVGSPQQIQPAVSTGQLQPVVSPQQIQPAVVSPVQNAAVAGNLISKETAAKPMQAIASELTNTNLRNPQGSQSPVISGANLQPQTNTGISAQNIEPQPQVPKISGTNYIVPNSNINPVQGSNSVQNPVQGSVSIQNPVQNPIDSKNPVDPAKNLALVPQIANSNVPSGNLAPQIRPAAQNTNPQDVASTKAEELLGAEAQKPSSPEIKGGLPEDVQQGRDAFHELNQKTQVNVTENETTKLGDDSVLGTPLGSKVQQLNKNINEAPGNSEQKPMPVPKDYQTPNNIPVAPGLNEKPLPPVETPAGPLGNLNQPPVSNNPSQNESLTNEKLPTNTQTGNLPNTQTGNSANLEPGISANIPTGNVPIAPNSVPDSSKLVEPKVGVSSQIQPPSIPVIQPGVTEIQPQSGVKQTTGEFTTMEAQESGAKVPDGVPENKSSAELPKLPTLPEQKTNEKPYISPDFSQSENSHFMVYLVTFAVMVAVFYVLYHNKQKLMGLLIEGRSGTSRSRRGSVNLRYKKLPQNEEEIDDFKKPAEIIY